MLGHETQELAEQISKKLQVQLQRELQSFLKQLQATLNSHSNGACGSPPKAASLRVTRPNSLHPNSSVREKSSTTSPTVAWTGDEASVLAQHRRGYYTHKEIEYFKADGEYEVGTSSLDASDQVSKKPDTGQMEQIKSNASVKSASVKSASVTSKESISTSISELAELNLRTDTMSKVYYHANRSKMSKQQTGIRKGVTVMMTNGTYQFIEKLVRSFWFDAFLGLSILTNAVLIGVQADWGAKHRGESIPRVFRIFDIVFCAVFVIELCLRLYVYRLKFYCMRGWGWNLFDTCIVLAQVLEEALMAIGETNLGNLSFMRIVRIFRLIRIIRLVRILRLISELRLIVLSVIHSLQSLAWTIVLIVLLMYINAIWLTQLVADQTDKDDDSKIFYYYGSLTASIVSLFQSITGGIDWDDAMRPLTEEVSPFWGVVFCIYISFSVFAMLNVVTGVFVESALQSANQDKDITTVCTMGDFFRKVSGRSGKMSWQEFSSHLDSQHMKDYFKLIDMDTSQARVIFRLLDLDHTGYISVDDFLNGCVRLRGPAKAIDLAMLMHTVRKVEIMLKTEQPESLERELPKSQGLPHFQVTSGLAPARKDGAMRVLLEPLRDSAVGDDEVQSVEEL